jgi:hypothetical protein
MSRPLIVLTASSIFFEISDSTRERRRARVRCDDRDERKVDLGELIDAEALVADDTDDHEHEDEHGREDRPPHGDLR